MGAYRAAVVTAAGQNIIAQALADVKAVEFTSAKTSSYLYPSGTNITGLTGLQDVEQSVIPFAAQVMNGNVVQVSVRFDNDEITQQYPINTIGLYAKVKDGEEVLFSVIQAIIPDEMPVHSDVSPSAFIYNIQHTVQNAAQITIVVNPAGTATVQDIYGLTYPEFEDSGEAEGITGFPGFLEKIKSKMNIFEFYRNFKAGMQYVLHTGQIVNNCVSDASNLPLAAAQGKALWDRQTQLNSNLVEMNNNLKYVLSTDILAFALSDNAKVGLTSGHFSGDGYVGELPDPQLKYGTFEINRRNTGSISIKCFDIDHNSIWTNSHSNNTWKGWKKVAAIANSAHIALFQIDFYYAGAEITLNSDVTNYNRLIFLFGSPNSPDNGYETEEVYPWGIIYGSNELGAKQPNIGMTIRGEKVVFKWLSNTKIKYVSGSADLRCIYGFEE